MTQPADSEHSQPLSTREFGLLQRAVDRDPGTEQRGSFSGGYSLGNLQGVGCGRLYEFRVAAVVGDSGDLLPGAEVFVALQAEFALPACPMNPRHANVVSHAQIADF